MFLSVHQSEIIFLSKFRTAWFLSWKSKKNLGYRVLTDLLSKKGFNSVWERIFFRPPTLTGHSFAAPWAMMMKSSSFESPKLYLLTHNSKNSIAALLTPVRTWWKVLIYYINVVLVILIWTALYVLSTKSNQFSFKRKFSLIAKVQNYINLWRLLYNHLQKNGIWAVI